MASNYIYLMSSLPMLKFGQKAPLSKEDLMSACTGKISAKAEGLLKKISSLDDMACCCVANDTLNKWHSFETMIRNQLVKIRALRKKVDPAKYLRHDGCPESVHAAHIAINAYRKPSILESELDLDRERWWKLDELNAGHTFDLSALLIYAIKLSILEKWDKVDAADKRRLLEDTLKDSAS